MSQDIESMFEEAPVLTFEIGTELESESEQTIEVVQKEQKIVLTPEEQKMVEEFAAKIDLTNSNMILQYGAGAQKKIANFSESALNNVRTKDLGEVGQMLTDVVTELKTLEVVPEEKGIMGFFKRSTSKLTTMKVKYDKAEVNVNRICSVLESHQIQLLKDIAMLDKMYDLNTTYFKELSMYILAGKKRLEEVKVKDIPALLAKANSTGLPEDAQAANDLASLYNRFEKKLHDLELTRMVSLQMAPQIRLVQGNDTVMA
ncbi:MAG: toxic anion resistance protein, partial [Cellulosilyticaceae bacterium]